MLRPPSRPAYAVGPLYAPFHGQAISCAGSRHIGHRLLSLGLCGQSFLEGLVELIWGEIAERLVQSPGLVAVVPGEEGVLEPAEVGGQIVDVVELIVVGPKGAFDASVALG